MRDCGDLERKRERVRVEFERKSFVRKRET
jgi:hypothetical protein